MDNGQWTIFAKRKMDDGQFKENILKDKAYQFALRIVNLYKFLTFQSIEFVLSKQILRCGTSVVFRSYV